MEAAVSLSWRAHCSRHQQLIGGIMRTTALALGIALVVVACGEKRPASSATTTTSAPSYNTSETTLSSATPAMIPVARGSPEEMQIRTTVLRSIISSPTLSVTGKNVNVVSDGSKITLRGPVTSDAEKMEIE